MKKILYIVIGCIGLALVGPSFVDWGAYKEPILQKAQEATGYTLDIRGPVRISLLPMPHFVVNDLSVKAKSGDKTKNLFDAKSISLRLNVLPLLRGKIEIDQVEIIEPIANLDIAKDGTPNWDVQPEKTLKVEEKSKKTTPVTVDRAPLEPSVDLKVKPSASSAFDLGLQHVIITRGSAHYKDQQKEIDQKLTNINIGGSMKSLSGPYDVTGSLESNGIAFKVDAKITHLFVEQFTLAKILVSATKDKENYGSLKADWHFKGKNFKGTVSVDSLKIPYTADLPNKKINLLQGISGIAQAEGSKDLARIPTLTLAVGGLKLAGSGTYQAGHAVVDLAMTEGDSALALKADGKTTDKILWDGAIQISSPKPQGFLKWFGVDEKTPYLQGAFNLSTQLQAKNDTYTLAALKAKLGDINTDGAFVLKFVDRNPSIQGTVCVNVLRYADYQAANVGATVSLQNGNLALTSLSAQAYGGTVSGAAQMNRGNAYKAQIDIRNINVASLPATKGGPLKKGTLSASANLSATGETADVLTRSLTGDMKFNLSQGIVETIDTKKFVADLKQARNLDGLSVLFDDLKTRADVPFSWLKGDFVVRNGRVDSQTIDFVSDDITAQGKGTIDIPAWRLDLQFALRAKELPKLPPIILRVNGSLDAPGYGIDKDQMAKLIVQRAATQAVDDVVHKTVDKALGQDVGNAVRGLLGVVVPAKKGDTAGKKSEEQKADQPKPINPQDLVKGLLSGKW
ncbi:MAG: AsmA family protein [Alphaproteobacteria bacterium]|nr:AsmA family protein [Alphaproteobacteria bacterium]